nr:bifunctional 2-C-methyl-D-erythritol 4-phosphate cytidylyltransferase/2-C-methyl-D-erythritol 2,4-cyclodiphosphate synthase [uncultured Sphingomonas sp.]
MTVTALIVAAGSGTRLGGDVPKQYLPIGGKTLLAHAVDALASHPRITAVRVVIGAGQEQIAATALGGRDVGGVIIGGKERSDSVKAGLGAVTDGIVLIHDAARPFCPPEVIDRLLDALENADGAVPALPVADTLARGRGRIDDMVDRKDMLRIQTPQAFHVEDLRYAIGETRGRGTTDESSILVAAGLKVAAVEGSTDLEKITTAADFARAEERMTSALVSRTGMGFDVHAFAGDGPIMMGGIEIPSVKGLAGHSDADVVLHSITDALLGAAAMGDIGQHFPPSDPQWKGADSTIFLAHAAALVRDAGGIIDFVDCTVICEAPKVSPYREQMRNRVAEILALPASAVSIKATTTEKLGFAGRGEGIAAQAVATIRIEQ